MIFDTPEMQRLRDKYKNMPDFDAPEIVLLDRSQNLLGEREYLEETIRLVPEYTRKKWVGNLLSNGIENHMGAWFEMCFLDGCKIEMISKCSLKLKMVALI